MISDSDDTMPPDDIWRDDEPRPGSTWQHREGNTYTIAPCPDIGMIKIPGAGWLKGPWVRYFDDHDFYCRTLADFTPLQD